MGFFTKLEKLSEKYIEGFFKNKFGGHVQPAEIAKLLLREMRDNKTVSVSRVYVPNEYTVFLGPEDWKTIDSVHVSLSGELQEFVMQKAADKGYEMVGAPKVAFELDGELSLGTVAVESGFSESLPTEGVPVQAAEPAPAERFADRPAATAAEGTIIADRECFYGGADTPVTQDTLTKAGNIVTRRPKAILVQKLDGKDGMAFSLGEHGVVIGRKRSNDISLDDTNVSRVHASIDFWEGDYYITDLGSTNGTFVNGTRVSKKRLAEGDLITMGTTALEFRVV